MFLFNTNFWQQQEPSDEAAHRGACCSSTPGPLDYRLLEVGVTWKASCKTALPHGCHVSWNAGQKAANAPVTFCSDASFLVIVFWSGGVRDVCLLSHPCGCCSCTVFLRGAAAISRGRPSLMETSQLASCQIQFGKGSILLWPLNKISSRKSKAVD